MTGDPRVALVFSHNLARYVATQAAREHADGMVLLSSPLIYYERSHIANLAVKGQLPTNTLFTAFPKLGGLEVAALYHSITSSASESSVEGSPRRHGRGAVAGWPGRAP